MFKRYIESQVDESLSDTPVVCIMGPRQSGKTTLVKEMINEDWQYITLDNDAYLNIAQADAMNFIESLADKHVVIDEIQRCPSLFLAIKKSVDENRKPARFILTGSANALLLPQLADALVGRMETIQLSPLSECELTGRQPTFLNRLLSQTVPSSTEVRIKDYLLKRIVMGSFPEPIQRSTETRAKKWYKHYVNTLIQRDIKDLTSITHPESMTKLLKISAFYAGKLIVLSELGAKVGLDRLTIKKYIGLLEQLFLVQQLPAWHNNEFKRLIKTPKMHAIDTGLLCAIRGFTVDRLIKHPEAYGLLLETFVVNELIKQSVWLDESLSFSHYRDKDKVECDLIIEDTLGHYYAIEIKGSASLGQKDFTGLKRVKSIAGKNFKMGILLYDGVHTTSFGEDLYAVPIASLWAC